MGVAIAALNSGKQELALLTCLGILQRIPENPAAHQLLAVIYLERGEIASARTHIGLSLQTRPGHVPSLSIAGKAARMDGDIKAAVAYFERAATLAPEEFEPAYLHGISLLEQADCVEAKKVFEKLLRLYPENALAWGGLGSALQQARMGIEAKGAFEKALALNPAWAEAWFNLGLVLQDIGDLPGAASALRFALQHRPGYAEAAVNLGIVLQESGQMEQAMKAYGQAFKLRAGAFGRIANALTSGPHGRQWLNLSELRALLAA